jgi:hypothetical protein
MGKLSAESVEKALVNAQQAGEDITITPGINGVQALVLLDQLTFDLSGNPTDLPLKVKEHTYIVTTNRSANGVTAVIEL